MTKQHLHSALTWLIASIWLINGLICKMLYLVPRHEEIVARILGESYAEPLTILIGVSELVMCVWVLSRWKHRLNAIMQMVVVATMNVLEFLLVPDLLLWGRMNVVFALIFILLLYYHEFLLGSSIPNTVEI
ncbi:MAG: DoxX-like family protein [Bacteroidota bacterium]